MDPNANRLPVTPNQVPPKPVPASNILIILLVVLVLLLAGGLGYMAFQNYILQNKLNVMTASINPSPQSSSTPNSTADWKTEHAGFITINYPPDFQLNPSDFAPAQDVISLAKDNSFASNPDLHLTTRYILEIRAVPADTPASCYVSSHDKKPITNTQVFGDNTWYAADPYTGAAAGTHVTTHEYHALFFNNSACYEVDLEHWASSDWNNPQAQIQADSDAKTGFSLLEQILSTSKFTK